MENINEFERYKERVISRSWQLIRGVMVRKKSSRKALKFLA